MKKLLFVLCLALGSQVLLAQEDVVYKFTIWVEDAVGNRDSVRMIEYLNEYGPIEGDTSNLYGIVLEKDLDIRFICRTDKNYSDTSEYGSIDNYWLHGYRGKLENGPTNNVVLSYGWAPASSKNADFKSLTADITILLCSLMKRTDLMPISISAKHYPVNLYLDYESVGSWPGSYITIHDTNTGRIIDAEPFIKFKDVERLANVSPFYYEVNYYPFSVKHKFFHLMEILNDSSCVILFENYHLINLKEEPFSIKKIYPNPAENCIILDSVDIESIFILSDSKGNVIKTFEVTDIPFIINISFLTSGNYYLINQSKKTLYKFVKEGGKK